MDRWNRYSLFNKIEHSFFVRFLFILIFLSGLAPLCAEEQIVPPLDQVAKITLSSNGAWFVDIKPDGSGHIQFGQQERGWGAFPKDSFSFAEIYNQLKPALQKEGNAREFVGVAMRRPGQVTCSSVYLKNADMARAIYREAFAKARNQTSLDLRLDMDAIQKKCPFLLTSW